MTNEQSELTALRRLVHVIVVFFGMYGFVDIMTAWCAGEPAKWFVWVFAAWVCFSSMLSSFREVVR